jgi:hypothetical protein
MLKTGHLPRRQKTQLIDYQNKHFVAPRWHSPIQQQTIKLKNMKRFNQFALTAALLVTLGVSSSFAGPVNGQDNINASFHKDFRQAELMATNAGKDYTKITFKMNGMILFAFYSDNGELLAVTHNIQSTQLPLSLLIQLRRNYADYWISDLFEYNANGASTYYITLENTGKKVTLRSNEENWESYTTTTKQ